MLDIRLNKFSVQALLSPLSFLQLSLIISIMLLKLYVEKEKIRASNLATLPFLSFSLFLLQCLLLLQASLFPPIV